MENVPVSDDLTLYHKAGNLPIPPDQNPQYMYAPQNSNITYEYIIKDCGNNGIYKIVRLVHSDRLYIKDDEKQEKENETKLDNNVCRARSKIIELALCNEWEWFCCFTLNPDKYNRKDLDTFAGDISQWIRDKRKEYIKKGSQTKLQYLLIPEQHKDGAWHMHGLFNGIPYIEIKRFNPAVAENDKQARKYKQLDRAGYLNFPAYQKKFGFVSMGRIKDKMRCALYISKYISKDFAKRNLELNKHLHYSSQGLNGYENVSNIIGHVPELDSKLINHNEFCSTGIVFNEVETFSQRFEKPELYKAKIIEKNNIDEKKFLFIADVINENDLIKMY